MDGVTPIEKPGLLAKVLQNLTGKRVFIDGEPYLTRYYLLGNGSGRGVEIYLHTLHKPDSYRWLHNHPWKWFFSIVLRGHYVQDVIDVSKEKPSKQTQTIRWFNFFRNTSRYHSINYVVKGGTWTLVIVPPKTRMDPPWGYWDEVTQSHIPDENNNEQNCYTEQFGNKQLYD